MRRRLIPAPVVGLVLLVLAWDLAVRLGFSGHGSVPGPAAVARQFSVDGLGFYLGSALPTLQTAAVGWLIGNALAIVLAFLVVAVPAIERPVLSLGAVSYCLPLVAIGPVLVVTCSDGTPRIILSALSVFFVTLVSSVAGLRSVGRALLDLLRAFGGGSLAQLREARWPAALPHLFAALRIGAPAAILGSIVGEFLGAERGLGVVLINAQQAMNYPRIWAIAFFTTGLAGAAYLLIGAIGSLLTPWARETHANLAGATAERRPGRSRLVSAAQAAGAAGLSVAAILALWDGLLHAFHVSTFIGKTPREVWGYVFDPSAGADNRAALAQESWVTLRDAGVGLAAGTAAAVVLALLFNLAPTLRRLFMGPALALQSVPLVALTPLIVLVFGRQLGGVAVIGGVVTFFPTLVNVTLALERTPRDTVDLMTVFGASRLDTLRTVQIPAALPALFASLRIAAPLAVTGAMLAEWLATGGGLGYSIASDVATSDYDALWARVALATFFSLIVYQLIRSAERAALDRIFSSSS
ncbi:MAG TPA: ABC transporter permease subunit [Opitutaceae bacterium]|jgi:ABC-type nitrate/sulfonate/bicarbonate transport system permease component|nr:ABC transporter permease subunit [Opitutaceae bacterium]